MTQRAGKRTKGLSRENKRKKRRIRTERGNERKQEMRSEVEVKGKKGTENKDTVDKKR